MRWRVASARAGRGVRAGARLGPLGNLHLARLEIGRGRLAGEVVLAAVEAKVEARHVAVGGAHGDAPRARRVGPNDKEEEDHPGLGGVEGERGHKGARHGHNVTAVGNAKLGEDDLVKVLDRGGELVVRVDHVDVVAHHVLGHECANKVFHGSGVE